MTPRILFILLFFHLLPSYAQKIENLGNMVNSEYNEINPLISPDGKLLFFARVSHPQNTNGTNGSQDIWYSELQNDQWSLARRMGNPLNKDEYNCACSITPDGNKLLILGATDITYETRGFLISKRTANGWSQPQKLNIPNLEKLDKGKFMVGVLSNDGKTLLMSFSEKKNSTKDDLYASFLQKNGTWSKIVYLGNDICTEEFTETTPFLASDGVTLYFSSDRTGGQGSNDIYYTKRLDKTWEKWSKPVNLGPAINTEAYDAYYTVAASGDYAYMVSKKNTLGKGDIIRVKLRGEGSQPIDTSTPVAPAPEPVVLVSGKVIDPKTGKPIDAKIIYENLLDGVEIGTAQTNPLTGEYKIVLPKGKKYAFRAIAKDYLAESQSIDLTNIDEYKEITNSNLKLVAIEEGAKIALNNLFFDTGKADVRPDSYPELDRIALSVTENPKLIIEIGGHTDNVGKDEANQTLSQGRADSVREYIIGKGVEPDRIKSKGYGETQPIQTNDTDEGRQANRRVEVKILKK
jgi:outer membrane protein OmpA-like peptidoglycan-associated protein